MTAEPPLACAHGTPWVRCAGDGRRMPCRYCRDETRRVRAAHAQPSLLDLPAIAARNPLTPTPRTRVRRARR
jgi:hypothetical protein